MPGIARVLVVANRTADSDELLAALLERQAQGSISVTLVAPARWEVTNPHGGKHAVLRRLRSATDRLREAGIETEGIVGDPDPLKAVAEIWNPERFDEVIVCTLPERLSRWLRLDLPRRVERLTGRNVPTWSRASERSRVTLTRRRPLPHDRYRHCGEGTSNM